MVFLDPVSGVAEKKVTHWTGLISIKINSRAPICFVLLCKVGFRKFGKKIAVGPQVVVHNIQDHCRLECMGLIDKFAEIIGTAIISGWGEQIHTVITPTELTNKISN